MNQLQQYNESLSFTGSSNQKQDECHLCQGEPFNIMLRRALYQRYFYSQEQHITYAVDDLINEQINEQTVKFKQNLIKDEDEQYLKRQYKIDQFGGKIEGLSQYYKFHRDVPRIFQLSTQKILNKYYDRLRNFDYKVIKRTLKQQQGISLTTQKSEQSFYDGTSIEIKSRYSSVLNDLNDNSQNQSIILKDMCKKIGKAFQKMNLKNDFKGVYYSGQKQFREYLFNLKANKKYSNQPATRNLLKNVKQFKETKTHYQLYPKSLKNLMSINISGSQPQFRKSSFKKRNQDIDLKMKQKNNNQPLVSFKKPTKRNGKSIQKTTANQTISREERSKRFQKSQKNISNQIQKNIGIFKPLSADLIALKSNTMLKTLTQIYKPNSSGHEKYNSDKSRKNVFQTKNNFNLHRKYQSKLDQYSHQKLVNQGQSRKSSTKNSKHNSRDVNHMMDNVLLLNNGETDRQNIKNNAINNAPVIKRKSVQKNSSKKQLKRSVSTSKKSFSKVHNNKIISTNPSIHNLLRGNGHSTQKIINMPFFDQNLNGGSLTERRVQRQSSKKKLPSKDKQNIRDNILKLSRSKSRASTSNLKNKINSKKQISQKNLHELKRQPSSQKKDRLSRNSSKSSLKGKIKYNQKINQKTKNQSIKKLEEGKNLDKLLEKKLALFEKS